MRARAIREGSVGLLILVGVGLFGVLVLWLRGLNPGNRNYEIAITFDNSLGMQIGTPVRYRGVPVGRVVEITPLSNEIEVLAEITEAGLRIPKESIIAANQSGFIGETTIDITPEVELSEAEQAVKPTSRDCESGMIICDADRIDGLVGVSYEALLRSAIALSNTLTDPTLVANLKTTLENTMAFTERATVLTEQLSTLADSAQEEIEPLSDSVQQATNRAAVAADNAAAAAQEIQITTAEARTLLEANRFNITNTLDNISQGSNQLTSILATVDTELAGSEFIDNLEILSANAAEASFSLRDASADLSQITGSFNQPDSLFLLQQTLASARDVFQSAQKILSDVDELTGDPTIRNSLRDLINGLSNLVSSTQILEQQTELAAALAPLSRLPTPLTAPVPAGSTPTSTVVADYQELQTQLKALADFSSPSSTEPPSDPENRTDP